MGPAIRISIIYGYISRSIFGSYKQGDYCPGYPCPPGLPWNLEIRLASDTAEVCQWLRRDF